jgi:hypothetical protein
MKQKATKKRKTPLPRPKLPCPCIYMLTGTQEPDPREAKLVKVDWKAPVGVAAIVRMDGKEYHMALGDIIPLTEETERLAGYLRNWIITQHDAKQAAAEERKRLWKKSLLAILESEQGK